MRIVQMLPTLAYGDAIGNNVIAISDALKAELAQEIRSGLTIRPVKGIQAGFRLAANDGSGYFDCSDEEIMEMLMPYFRNLDI